MRVHLSSDLAGYKGNLVPAPKGSPCYLVVYASLSSLLSTLCVTKAILTFSSTIGTQLVASMSNRSNVLTV
jgi:hypothetical protein